MSLQTRQALLQVLTGTLNVFLAGIASTVSQLSLSPVYGSIVASRYHAHGTFSTAALALSIVSFLRSIPLSKTRRWLPVLAWYAMPLQHYLCRFSGYFGPVYGPLITEACTYYPLLLCSLVAAINQPWMSSVLALRPTIWRRISSFIVCGVFVAAFSAAGSLIPSLVVSSAVFTRSGLQLLVASGYTLIVPSKLVLLTSLPMLWVATMDPHLSFGAGNAVVEQSLKLQDYTLLERKESLTGYLSVLDGDVTEFRVLRCDHSLLGGDWLVTDRSRKRGLTKRETVYSVFTMLEAVRLIERDDAVSDQDNSALFIGLGIGTSPKAFIEHGINTTIVELDPVVHEFATKYFEFPGNHHAYLQDATSFVDRYSVSNPRAYDYIVHDVFTGGAEPTALFTLEFLQRLGQLLKDDGAIAINYAADLSLPVAKVVIRTVLEVFPSCRIFRDIAPEQASAGNTFVNMIVFCKKQHNTPIKFRTAVEGDWLGSWSRRQWIPPKDNLEMPVSQFLDIKEVNDQSLVLRKGEERKIEMYHQVSAERHWRIMRTVLPDAVWELW